MFRADQMLADALHEGLTGKSSSMMASLSVFEQRRNDAEFPYYNFTYEAATLQPPDVPPQNLFAQLAEDKAMASAFVGLFAQATSPADYFQNSV